jgi:hypothetical protein
VGGGVSAFTGIAPRPGFSLTAFGEARRRSLSIGGELVVSVAPGDRLDVALGAVDVAPCARFSALLLCGLAEVGWLNAWHGGLGAGPSDGSPFVALGARGGVEVPFSEQVFLRLQSDLVVEAYGPRFAVPGSGYDAPGFVYSPSPMPMNSSIVMGVLGVGLGAYLR